MKPKHLSCDEIIRVSTGRDWVDKSVLLDELLQMATNAPLPKGLLRSVVVAARSLSMDPISSVRMEAVELLGVIGRRSDLLAVTQRTADEEWAVRCSAYSALAALGRRGNARTIRRGLEDPNPHVRRYAAVALYDLIGCEAVPYVRARLGHETDDFALVGYWRVLALCGDEDAKMSLKALESSPVVALRELAVAD